LTPFEEGAGSACTTSLYQSQQSCIFHDRDRDFQGTQSLSIRHQVEGYVKTSRQSTSAQFSVVQGLEKRPREGKREQKVGIQGKDVESLCGHVILQWRYGKG
jgi:hypothetical protein